MKSIKEILEESPSPYKGSQSTFATVADQIEQRFGKQAREEYDPLYNCRSYADWRKVGFCPIKGSKALHSTTMLEQKDASGKVIKRWPRKINLFFISQVKRVEEGDEVSV